MPNFAMLFRTKNQENFLTCLFNHTCPILQLFSELKIKIIHRPFICSYMLSFAMVFRTKKSGQFLDLSIHSYLPNSAIVFRTKNQK